VPFFLHVLILQDEGFARLAIALMLESALHCGPHDEKPPIRWLEMECKHSGGFAEGAR
jgi:hypothetical protein